MVLFRGLNKSTTDLLQRDFIDSKTWKVDLTHARRTPIVTYSALCTPSGALMASASLKHSAPYGAVSYTFGSTSMSGDANYKVKIIPGLMFSGRFERKHEAEKGARKLITDVSLEYSPDSPVCDKARCLSLLSPHMKLSMDPTILKWTASAASGLGFGIHSSLLIGAEASGNDDLKSCTFAAGIAFSQTVQRKLWTAALMGYHMEGKRLGKIVGGLHCKGTDPGSAEIGAEITHVLSSVQPPKISFGGLWFLQQASDNAKKDSYVKVKLTQDAKVAVAFTHKLSDLITATIGTQIDALKPASASCGLAVKITA